MENSSCSIEFRIAEEQHVKQMHEIEEAVFPVPWSYESLFQDVCQHEIAVYIVGLHEDEVVSYGGFWFVLDEAHVTNLAVKKSFRRLGVGGAMMDVLFSAAAKIGVKSMTLEVRRSNDPAIALYKKKGFEKAGIRRKYYADNGEDAILMTKNL